MSFAQPLLLGLLLAVPLLLGAYLWQLRRRRRRRRCGTPTSRSCASRPARMRRWRRHVPIGLVLASLALLGMAAARPQVRADVPVSSATIILALDVSGSMCATDVAPNRLGAAQAAVRSFVEGSSTTRRRSASSSSPGSRSSPWRRRPKREDLLSATRRP